MSQIRDLGGGGLDLDTHPAEYACAMNCWVLPAYYLSWKYAVRATHYTLKIFAGIVWAMYTLKRIPWVEVIGIYRSVCSTSDG